MKKLSVKEAVKKVVEDREAAEALAQTLKEKKDSPKVWEIDAMGNQEIIERNVEDNLSLLSKVLEIHGGIVTGSAAQLKTELDGKINDAIKEKLAV